MNTGKPSRKGSESTTSPIALPHDGPLSRLISQRETLFGNDGSVSGEELLSKIVELDETTEKCAIIFLLRAKCDSIEPTDFGLFSDKVNLLRLLVHASHIHEQLRALQKFRNKLIQNQSRTRNYVENDTTSILMYELFASKILYRILLEWMISVLTPVPLRRAVASCMSVLLPPVPLENEDHVVLTRNNVLFDVLESILQQSCYKTGLVVSWQNPLHSLLELLSWGSSDEFFNEESCILKIMEFLQAQAVYQTENQAPDIADQVTLMANLINKILIMAAAKNRLLLQSPRSKSYCDIVADLQIYLWNSLLRRDIPIDRLSNVGIAYGRTVLWHLFPDDATSGSSTLPCIFEAVSTMPSVLHRAAVLQGLAVVVPMNSSYVLELMATCRRIFVEAADPDVRALALKGVRTLISRIHTWYSNTNNTDVHGAEGPIKIGLDLNDIRRLIDETLSAVLPAWENPPTRNLANAIPSVFENLIELLLLVSVEKSLDGLTERLLAQAPNMKCRYLALDVLLPITGASRLVKSNSRLLNDLLVGIGDQGHNTGVIADLWVKLLKHLHVEYNEKTYSPTMSNDEHSLSTEWLELWSPSLVRALSSKDVTRRKQVAAFCLPRIFAKEFISPSRPMQMAFIVESLLSSVEQLLLEKIVLHQRRSIHGETIVDRVLWVQMEIIRYAAAEGLLKTSSVYTKCLRDKVATTLPKNRLQSGIVHDLPIIRITALQVMGSIVGTYGAATSSSLDLVRSEVELWAYALPSSIKADGKEYILSMHQCLLLFLDRLLLTEASVLDETERNHSELIPLPLFHSFVVDFLINDILLKKTGYPGTVALKESFLLSLVECLVVFSLRDHPLATDSKLLPKNLPVFRRRRLDVEERAINEMKKSLCSSSVVDCLTTLLHSTWDSSRTGAYRMLLSLLHLRRVSLASEKMCLDPTISNQSLSRGIFLASSARQREADTGAKLISFRYLSLSGIDEKRNLLASLVDLLDQRLTCMKQQLAALLSSRENHAQAHGLPMAHGIVHTLRLVTESHDLPLNFEHKEFKDYASHIFDRIIVLFFRALRVSLAVVADVNNGEIINGMDEEIISEIEGNRSVMMVNPSAIGANGIFSSVKRFSSAETSKRLASQRIVIGSWLLTKETCAAIASFLSLSIFKPSTSVYDEAGNLLISTLTALKHTGAAFAAHRALQRVAHNCFSDKSNADMLDLPRKWGLRMISEISDSEKIRNSILRRSTGYSLGFLSLMRAEVSIRKQPPYCLSLLVDIMRLCLPSRRQWNEFATKMKLCETLKSSLFPFSVREHRISLVADSHFNLQARVHALNVLRSCLLDSPIADEVFPCVGFAFIAAMIGYADSEWSVRNSSTMVFAAAMLRSVDPDKNSTRTDATGRNAITADELFRSFPPLAPFALAILNGGFQDVFEVPQSMSLLPVLPILLLLSRIQPISQSGDKSMLHVEPFVPAVLKYLRHQQIKIRKSAAQAIRNMVSENMDSPISIYSIMPSFQQNLSIFTKFSGPTDAECQWNYLHGLLLTVLELSLFFPDRCFQGDMLEEMRVLTTLYNGSLRVPPLCAMIAIKIMWHLLRNSDYSLLMCPCREITLHLERMHRLKAYDIGSAELGSQVSSIWTTILSSTLLHDTASSDEKYIVIENLSLLLHADCIDLRFSAVKTFKKILRQFTENQPDDHDLPDQCILTIAELLRGAFIHEIHRHCFHGPHPPTLRRLSRSLIDWIESHRKTKMGLQSIVNFKVDDLLKSLLTKQSFCKFIEFDPISMSQLIGNCLELFNLKEVLVAEDLKLFSQLVIQLSNPSCYWRVRYSAARSLGRIVQALTEDSMIFSPPEKSILFGTWFALIQDEDFEVRQAASSATWKLCCLRPHHVAATDFSSAMKSNSDSISTSSPKMVSSMLLFLYHFCGDVSYKMKEMVDKRPHTRDSEGFPVFVNDAVMQTIFEKENPNSYIESCVQCQLMVVSIVNMTESVPFHMNGDLVASTSTFLNYVYSIFTLLHGWTHDMAIISDVTCSNLVFPCLHNILLITLTLVYITGDLFAELIDDITLAVSNTIALNPGFGSLDHLHPLLLQAMQSLLHAKQSKLQTLNALKQCCFLVTTQENQ